MTQGYALGLRGATGYQGAQGFQGTGFQGVQGSQGWQGNTGPQGNQGNQGWQGLAGSQGNQGFQGGVGPQGNQGWQGAQGSQGWQGVQGFVGNEDLIYTIIKSADQSVTSSVALQDDTELKFAMAANTSYAFRISMKVVSASATPDIKVALNGPAGLQRLEAYVVGYGPDYASIDDGGWITAYETAISMTYGAAPIVSIEIFGTVKNGSTAGDLVLRWAQRVSNANATTVAAGSLLIAAKEGALAIGPQGPQGTNPGPQGPQGTNPGSQGPQGPEPTLVETIATADGTITTTSASPVLATGMTITPPSGKYLCFFTGSCFMGTSDATHWVDTYIYSDGAAVSGAQVRNSDGEPYATPFCVVGVAEVSGTQAIEGRWSRIAGGGTASMLGVRTLTLVKIG